MNNNDNSRKETMKKLALSAAMMNVLLASNVSVATAQPLKANKDESQAPSYQVTSVSGQHEVEWFDSGCTSNSGCGAT